MKNLYALVMCLLCLTAFEPVNAQAPQHRITLNPALRPFYHGVASGDPAEDRVIIWTRVTPDTGTTGPVEVFWQLATDTLFQNVVNYGKLQANAAGDYCVKTDVCGLQPNTFYYYMFRAFGRNSITGRTKTAPAATADNDSIRFAVVSCADYENGFFHAYESISNNNNVDAVVHLGDYIYEYEPGGISTANLGRTVEPDHEIITPEDYSTRHSLYKLDNQLRRAHQLFPFITVWDDHETSNNAWRDGAGNHQPATEGPYSVRKWNATSTYFNWMPLRKPDPNDTIRIFRTLRYGKLLDLIMLDTRLYDRDEQDLGARNDPNHKLMGPVEMAWFLQQLKDTATRWKIIGNQVMFAPLTIFGQPFNSDQWDGYNYERQIIIDTILQNNVQDVVVLTGDIHTSWCNDVPGANYNSNTGAGSVCVEFVGPSITSQNSPLPIGSGTIKLVNPHMKFIDLSQHGYYTLDVKKGRTQADYTFIQVDQPTFTDQTGGSYFVNHTERHLRQGMPITNAPQLTAARPSSTPNQSVPFAKVDDHYVTVPENTQVNVAVIPGASCPALSMTILQGQHGGTISLNGTDASYVPNNNYNGPDTVGFVVCTNDTLPSCDTVYLFVELTEVRDVDTMRVTWISAPQQQVCLGFDDLQTYPQTVTQTETGVPFNVQPLNDTCFTVETLNNFCGKAQLTFVATDSLGNTDTIVYLIKVGYYTEADTLELAVNKNSSLTHCLVFDDLFCPPTAIQFAKYPTHGTYQVQADTCIKYAPYYNYTGYDTMTFIACDTCGPDHCDTLMLVFNTQQPSAVESPDEMVVFSMYPNPVTNALLVQYYLYQPGTVYFNLYSSNGALVSTDNINHTADGIQLAQLTTGGLPAGIYVVEMKAGSKTYRQQIVKQ